MSRERQVLIFDADDTLWESNVLFERVIDDFVEWLRHPTLDKAGVRAILDDIEAANAVVHGYGSSVFLRSLADCFERLRERPATEAERRQIDDLAVALVEHRVEPLPRVPETLAVLGERHELLMLTKGDNAEQQRKVDASDLAHHFTSVNIVPEKNVDTYLDLVRKYELPPATTWMIGNSPKSDIMPARQAGLNAVFIPSVHTWVLENGDVDPDDPGILRLHAFPDLLEHF
jgi:putative hydrolase of the HAD superfamily